MARKVGYSLAGATSLRYSDCGDWGIARETRPVPHGIQSVCSIAGYRFVLIRSTEHPSADGLSARDRRGDDEALEGIGETPDSLCTVGVDFYEGANLLMCSRRHVSNPSLNSWLPPLLGRRLPAVGSLSGLWLSNLSAESGFPRDGQHHQSPLTQRQPGPGWPLHSGTLSPSKRPPTNGVER